MKFEKLMNLFFYILTVIFSLLFIGFIAYNFGQIIGIILLSLYVLTYYCHIEYKKYILNTYYIEKYADNREPDVAMIEDFYHSLGFADYKCNLDIDIKNYTDKEITEALEIYEKFKLNNNLK